MPQVFLILLILLLTCSCTTTYHAQIAPQYTSHTYKDNSFGSPPLFQSIQNKSVSEGGGLSLSIIETLRFVHARVGYFYNHYPTTTYSSTGVPDTQSNTSFHRSGFDLAAGPRLGWFKPYISYHLIDKPRGSEEKLQQGFGLRLEIPVWGKNKISIDYNRYEDQDDVSQGRSANINVAIGYMFGGWEFGGKKNSR